jgi:hypothetical protein
MKRTFVEQGLVDVTATQLMIRMDHQSFDDYWADWRRRRAARKVFGRSLQVVSREHLPSDGRDREFGAPVERVVELLSAQPINRLRICEAQGAPMPAIAIKDDADVSR